MYVHALQGERPSWMDAQRWGGAANARLTVRLKKTAVGAFGTAGIITLLVV